LEHSEDLELVARMLAGEERAFETFGERYFQALYRFASARLEGDRDLTREVVQTAMTKALAKLGSYRGEASLLTWLCACCRNEILMGFRQRRTAPVTVELEDAPASGGDPEVTLLGRERALRVHMTLDGLPDHYARALEWKYLDHLPVQEIAARMGVQPKAAESLLTRARQAFRTGYERLHGRLASQD
jgi:RNA polymerase sigma-70 factor, ECF subfamily